MTGLWTDAELAGVSWPSVRAQLLALGVRRAYVKDLAENDNSKNQIYLGRGDWGVLNAVPVTGWLEPTVTDRGSIIKGVLDLVWVDGRGEVAPVPEARLILYPQYPEVRLSGFLRGSAGAPRFVGQREPGRILVLGVSDHDGVFAFAARAEDPVAREIASLPRTAGAGALQEISLAPTVDPRHELLEALGRIHREGWIDSHQLASDGSITPCTSPNCGGYTLEAELGVTKNGRADPDFLGWEVKQHEVSDFARLEAGVLTLMTPEPTGGYYREAGVIPFVRKFGSADRLGRADRLNFGGVHRYGLRSPRTGLTLTTPGFEAETGLLRDPAGGIALVADDGTVAAMWHFRGLIEHWQRKHLRAVYVPSQRRDQPMRQYRYGPSVRLGERTHFGLFMSALAAGAVYYDPGIKVEAASTSEPRPKKRSQFRIHSHDLRRLYETLEVTAVGGGAI
jgi:hypothetical protein